jgi:hypothetical protein
MTLELEKRNTSIKFAGLLNKPGRINDFGIRKKKCIHKICRVVK